MKDFILTNLMKNELQISLISSTHNINSPNINTDEEYKEFFKGKNNEEIEKILINDLYEFCQINNTTLKNLHWNSRNKLHFAMAGLISEFEKKNKNNDIQFSIIKNVIEKIINIEKEKRENGWNIDLQDGQGFGNTALMVEISNGNSEIPQILIQKYNADPFIPDCQKKHSLHFLIAKGHKNNAGNSHDNQVPVFDLILNHKEIANHINDQDIFGNTPLHIACLRRDTEYIEKLIKKGAKLDIKNNEGKTPLDVAMDSDIERIFEIHKYILPMFHSKNNHKITSDDILSMEKTIQNFIFDENKEFKKNYDEIITNYLQNYKSIKTDFLEMKEEISGMGTIDENIFNQDIKNIETLFSTTISVDTHEANIPDSKIDIDKKITLHHPIDKGNSKTDPINKANEQNNSTNNNSQNRKNNKKNEEKAPGTKFKFLSAMEIKLKKFVNWLAKITCFKEPFEKEKLR